MMEFETKEKKNYILILFRKHRILNKNYRKSRNFSKQRFLKTDRVINFFFLCLKVLIKL